MSTIQRKPRSAHMTCTGGGLATVAASALASLAFAAPSLADEQPASAAAAGGSQANASGPVLPPPPIPESIRKRYEEMQLKQLASKPEDGLPLPPIPKSIKHKFVKKITIKKIKVKKLRRSGSSSPSR